MNDYKLDESIENNNLNDVQEATNEANAISDDNMVSATPSIEPKAFIDYPSLFTLLSAHYIDEDNRLRFGIQESKLLEILRIKKARLKQVLQEFQEEINSLGLEIVQYKDGASNWVTLRQERYAPLNLSKPAEILLGFSFGHFMELPRPEFKAEDFRMELTVRGFLTNAEYTNGLDELVKKRYLTRSRGIIRLGIRSELEFSEEARITIGYGALELLRGKTFGKPKETSEQNSSMDA